jgi:hypothetical protein
VVTIDPPNSWIDRMDRKTDNSQSEPPVLVKDWRFYLGITALALSIIMPVFALLVHFLGLSVAHSALVAGLLIGGGPELLALIAVSLLGKATFSYFLHRVKKFFRRSCWKRPPRKAPTTPGLSSISPVGYPFTSMAICLRLCPVAA